MEPSARRPRSQDLFSLTVQSLSLPTYDWPGVRASLQDSDTLFVNPGPAPRRLGEGVTFQA